MPRIGRRVGVVLPAYVIHRLERALHEGHIYAPGRGPDHITVDIVIPKYEPAARHAIVWVEEEYVQWVTDICGPPIRVVNNIAEEGRVIRTKHIGHYALDRFL